MDDSLDVEQWKHHDGKVTITDEGKNTLPCWRTNWGRNFDKYLTEVTDRNIENDAKVIKIDEIKLDYMI